MFYCEWLWLLKDYIFPILLALFLAYIAYQQMVTNRNKLRLDLYNKRFDVYTSAMKFYQELVAEGVTAQTHKEFIEQKEASQFLFSKDLSIYELLDTFHKESFKVHAYKNNENFKNYGPDLQTQSAKESNEVILLSGQLVNELSHKLKPYLNM